MKKYCKLGMYPLLHKKNVLDPWVGNIPWRREKLPTPVFWIGEFHGLYSPWGHKELDTTEQLSFSTQKPGEGKGNPFQYSSLENPKDRGAWWAMVQRVTQSWTRLKQLSMHTCDPEVPWYLIRTFSS